MYEDSLCCSEDEFCKVTYIYNGSFSAQCEDRCGLETCSGHGTCNPEWLTSTSHSYRGAKTGNDCLCDEGWGGGSASLTETASTWAPQRRPGPRAEKGTIGTCRTRRHLKAGGLRSAAAMACASRRRLALASHRRRASATPGTTARPASTNT
eukprot:TRINITY_DN2578_c0_g1_i1.p3 TRINITY_DN2578_c0_g1~~TRINITY_DN2578_c0_g1_i1.p3  ORF type:complete len:152 (-),score=4.37 TRINITY_DN2578_c0_g1_i1:1543-1998(-)